MALNHGATVRIKSRVRESRQYGIALYLVRNGDKFVFLDQKKKKERTQPKRETIIFC